jgi:hypothetical protein
VPLSELDADFIFNLLRSEIGDTRLDPDSTASGSSRVSPISSSHRPYQPQNQRKHDANQDARPERNEYLNIALIIHNIAGKFPKAQFRAEIPKNANGNQRHA